jgi:excinuclease ABC subunit B
LRDLRNGAFDVLVGVNLLREGLDLPEVSLVAIMEADKEGFLRGERALIQTIGRAARNVGGKVIMYADKHTDSMKKALSETLRRRELQTAHNTANDITPQTIVKEFGNSLLEALRGKPDPQSDDYNRFNVDKDGVPHGDYTTVNGKQINVPQVIKKLEKEMKNAAKNLDYERAAQIRDQLKVLQEQAARNRKT